MKTRFGLFLRGEIFYAYDKSTGKQESFRTDDKQEAKRLLAAKNEAQQQPTMNLHIARLYLAASDGEVIKRTWQNVMTEMGKMKKGSTHERWERAINDTAFDLIRNRVLLETRAEHFLRVLESGTVSTNVFLRRIHNFALDMTWLPCSIIPKKQWPPVRFQEKRGITFDEHQRIVAKERNLETRAFYDLCWHLGGAQSDIANLKASDIDWEDQVIAYSRAKTSAAVLVRFGQKVTELLRTLPGQGLLFPRIAVMHEKHRAKEFKRRCLSVGISGVTLHSYRYAWAERARTAGMSERHAMEMLGHNSKAVHRAYARKAQIKVPSLEECEMRAFGKVK